MFAPVAMAFYEGSHAADVIRRPLWQPERLTASRLKPNQSP
jgi:hypothetical protein